MVNPEPERLRQPIHVIAFDLDGTLAEGNIWLSMHTLVGVPLADAYGWVGQYEVGEITYQKWMEILSERYRSSGKKKEDFQALFEEQARKNVTNEVQSLIARLHYVGEELCIVSGGVDMLKNVHLGGGLYRTPRDFLYFFFFPAIISA